MAGTIDRFRGQYEFLSNFYPSPFNYRGYLFPTGEHAFQASKTSDVDVWHAIRRASSASAAKRMGRSVMLRPDWELVKDEVMAMVIAAKFPAGSPLAFRLMDTGDAELIEGNTWGDVYWGVDACTRQGRNQLGRTLMRWREYLQTGADALGWPHGGKQLSL